MPAKQKIFIAVPATENPTHHILDLGIKKGIHWAIEKEGYFLSQEELDREVEKRVHEKLKSYIKP